MTTAKTYHYRGYTGIGRQPRPSFVQCEIPALSRTVETRGDDLDVAEKLLQLTIDNDCLTAAEVEERDKDEE